MNQLSKVLGREAVLETLAYAPILFVLIGAIIAIVRPN
jgi:hypothetical protein